MNIATDPIRSDQPADGPPSAASAALDAVLQDAMSQARRMHRRARLIQAGWWWLAALLTVVISDAMWHWHEVGRVLGAAFLLLLATLLIARACFSKTAHATMTTQQLHAAAALEKHHGLAGQPLINALLLAQQQAHTNPASLTHQLQQRSLVHAANIASQADVAGSIDRRRYLFHRTRLAAVLAVCLLVALLMPRMTVTGLQRLVNPWGNHPPFSLTRFHISLPQGPIEQGSDATVDITLTGQLPATLDWVTLNTPAVHARYLPWRSAFVESQRWRLEPLSQGKYRHRLRHLDQAITFELQTDTGQSRRVTIDVQPRAVVTTQPATDAPEETPTPATQPPSSQSVAGDHQTTTSDNPDIQAAAAALQAMGIEAGRLASAAEHLQQQLQSAPPASSLSPQQLRDTMEIASQLEAFKRMTRDMQSDLKEQHAAAADQPNEIAAVASDQSLMLQMAQTLASLLTPKQAGPDKLDPATTDALAQSMSDLAVAARSDQQKLSQPAQAAGNTAGESENPSGETTAGHDASATDPSGDTQQLRQGAYHQTGERPANATSVQTQARSRGVPEMYRSQVERYFDRLNEDQSASPASNTTPPLHDGANP